MLKDNLDQIQNIGLPTFSFRSGGRSDPTVGTIITDLLPYIYGVAGIVLILNIITAGFGIMTSKGDPKALQSAQTKLTTSVIGVVILFVSFWIVQLVMKFLGLNSVIFN